MREEQQTLASKGKPLNAKTYTNDWNRTARTAICPNWNSPDNSFFARTQKRMKHIFDGSSEAKYDAPLKERWPGPNTATVLTVVGQGNNDITQGVAD